MDHLTETLLNEYLDAALDSFSRRQAETHLAACPACRARLDELQATFAALETVPEQALGRDLAPGVLIRLPRRRERLCWRLVLAAQAAGALGLLAWLFPAAAPPPFSWLRPVCPSSLGGWTSFLLVEGRAAWLAALPDLQPPGFQPGANLWAALVLAGLAFVAGNVFFLRSRGRQA
jgi:anti-sigma factor RsiW